MSGQARLGYPLFEQMAVLREAQLARVALQEFVLDQVLMQPAAFLLMVIGGVARFRLQALQRFRSIG